MALITCKECGKEVSENASVCPHCGAPVEKYVYCQQCGTKVPANTAYCKNCGARINPCTGTASPDGKDKLTTGLLGIFLGSLGIHYFYLGKPTAGILTIILSVCTCGIWSLLMFIQSIIILTMSDSDFRAKYVDTDKTFPLF